MMLGRKQSLKGEPVLADYGPDEAFNESADIEWVNMVRRWIVVENEAQFAMILLEMGETIDEIVCVD